MADVSSPFDDYEFSNVPAETPLSPEEAIIRRHRREKRDLIAKCQALKKGSTKDKKKKKEIADEIAKLEQELDDRHKLELSTFIPGKVILVGDNSGSGKKILEDIKEGEATENVIPSSLPVEVEVEVGVELTEQHKLSKAQKRREKKAAEDRERQKRIDEETKQLFETSDSKLEDEKLADILSNLKLSIVEIPSDGHCLYESVRNQLQNRFKESKSVLELRAETARHLKENRTEYIDFFDESIAKNEAAFEKYCNNVQSMNAAIWGGQIEVRVLSQILKRPIKVIQAEGIHLTFGEEFDPKDTLTLTYHRHKFKLGAHYNSVLPSVW